MKSSRVFGMIVAAGLVAATAARAQDGEASKGTVSTQAPTPYGDYVNGPATTDAQGVPVAKPNPISREEDEGVLGGVDTTPGELIDDSNLPDSVKSTE